MVNPSDDACFFTAIACNEKWDHRIDCLQQLALQSEHSWMSVCLCEGCVSPQRIDSMVEIERGLLRTSVVVEWNSIKGSSKTFKLCPSPWPRDGRIDG